MYHSSHNPIKSFWQPGNVTSIPSYGGSSLTGFNYSMLTLGVSARWPPMHYTAVHIRKVNTHARSYLGSISFFCKTAAQQNHSYCGGQELCPTKKPMTLAPSRLLPRNPFRKRSFGLSPTAWSSNFAAPPRAEIHLELLRLFQVVFLGD